VTISNATQNGNVLDQFSCRQGKEGVQTLPVWVMCGEGKVRAGKKRADYHCAVRWITT